MFNVKSRRYDMREKLYGSCCIRDNMLCQERAGCSNCMIWLQWQLDTMSGACYICRHNQGCENKGCLLHHHYEEWCSYAAGMLGG
jgi:hypothetical protein